MTVLYKMDREVIIRLIDHLMTRGHPVVGVQRKGAKYKFDELVEAGDFTFDYLPTILPMKKYFMPSKEVLFKYDKLKQTVEMPLEPRDSHLPEVVYFGLRECDLTGLRLLDEMMLTGEGDVYYREKRRNSLIVAIDCLKALDRECFCYKLHDKDYSIADLVLIPYGDGYGVDVKSERAKAVLDEFSKVEALHLLDDGQVGVAAMSDVGFLALGQKEAFENMANVEMVCEEEAENCFNCGTCTTVCPTCYCFSISDEDQINGLKGDRIRTWDGCRLEDFSLVAGGHRLVREGVDRAVHRFNRKYRNAIRSHDLFLCVGCGRCSRMCPTGNSTGTMMQRILEAYEDE